MFHALINVSFILLARLLWLPVDALNALKAKRSKPI